MEQPVIVEKDFNVSTERIWSAITDKDEMIQWFFEDIPDFKAEVGFETQFVVTPSERSFTHLWKITEVILNEKIVYDWSYEEYDGRGLVHFILSETNGGTNVKILNEWVEPFPTSVPEFSEENCRGGWEYFINRLYEYLH